MVEISNYFPLADKRRQSGLSDSKDISLQNRLVAMLPPAERAMLLDHGELVELAWHQKLDFGEGKVDYAYFPIDSFISIVPEVKGDATMEVATVGNEGMFNMATVLRTPASTFSALVQGAGRAIKIHRNAFHMRREEDVRLRNVLFRYIAVLTSHLAQRVVCMNHHTVEQRLARALLMSRDRINTHELFLTHDSLAFMTGVRRESISHAASTMQKYGWISYHRGYIVLLDESALELISCACYATDRAVYDRVMNG